MRNFDGRETNRRHVPAAFDGKREVEGRHDNSAHFGVRTAMVSERVIATFLLTDVDNLASRKFRPSSPTINTPPTKFVDHHNRGDNAGSLYSNN